MVHIRSWEIVVDALRDSDSGMRDAVNASKHGVAVRTVRRWRRVYQREQKARGQTHTTVPCPRCHEVSIDEAAYAELFGWYLGDGYLIEARRGVYTLSVFNDACYVELNLHIADLMRRVKPGGRPHIRRITGCLSTSVGWKHWPCLFPQHGRDANTRGCWAWPTGSGRSSEIIRRTSCAGCSIPMGAGSATGRHGRLQGN